MPSVKFNKGLVKRYKHLNGFIREAPKHKYVVKQDEKLQRHFNGHLKISSIQN